MKKYAIFLMAILFSWIAILPPTSASGARGMPGSPDIAYGGHLRASASSLEAARLAANLNLDWVSILVDWQSLAPQPTTQIEWSQLDQLIKISKSQSLILLSLTNAPAWAVTPNGPDAARTSQFLNLILQRYPNAIQAVELFPAANTHQGWRAAPNAIAYLNLLKTVQAGFQKTSQKPVLVAGGLVPLPPQSSTTDVHDLDFLQKLYTAGGAAVFQILSVNLRQITGQPLQNPTAEESRVLRHYEQIRQVMLKNNHLSGIIWITHLTVPSGKINPGENRTDPQQEDIWLAQAYRQIRSQLYIGAVFYDGLHPNEDNHSLILSDGGYHPFYRTLRGMIDQSTSSTSGVKPGRAKEQPLLKLP